jgi:predicted XRE-type DNA-binding protein
MSETLDVVRGSGNVFRDLKATLAAKIIGILDDRNLTVRHAEKLTGIAAADFSRIRKAKLDRFTIDRLMTMLNRFDQKVEVTVTIRPRRTRTRIARKAA